MERNTVERVTEWDSEPFSGGHAGLRDLAEREFTGAVTEGGAWLFMLNGRVLGVFDGDLSRFEDADGTAYTAPDRSLPLLFAMQETGGEVRGEYYTEQTPLSEVDQTLRSGKFTGYVELSENVLSGDYYLVYYGGRRLPVAFIGNQERRITGEDAFERADDEVGIYRVRTVELDISDVPEVEEPSTDSSAESAAAAAGATGAAAAESTDDRSADEPSTESEPTTARDSSQADMTPTAAPTDETVTESSTGDTDAATDETTTDTDSDEPRAETETDSDESRTASTTAGREPIETEPMASASAAAERAADEPTVETAEPSTDTAEAGESASESASERSTAAEQISTPSETEGPGPRAESSTSAGAQFEAEADWQGTTTIPALDPAESVSMAAETPGEPTADASAAATATAAEPAGVPHEEVAALRDERDRLRERVEDLEVETERLGGERDRLKRERDEATATAEELEDELETLRATVDELESELEAAESDLAAAEEYVPEGDHEVPPEEAMAGTSLFVRYEREGGPTLSDAHAGDAEREAVNDNLRLERHTEFDDDGAVVDGEPFDEWLRDTVEYGFVEWLTSTFVHDVRETRNQTAMGKLFDAVPEIDRVEFRGGVDLGEAADEESAAFDVVLRDRMGQPLVVTDLNDSRDPATEPMLESLIRNATPVAESNDRLAAAFFVTSSYYEPGALETAEEATGGGFLGRGKHKSFVKLTRKDGYHVCLVETRDGEFHVSLPEL